MIIAGSISDAFPILWDFRNFYLLSEKEITFNVISKKID